MTTLELCRACTRGNCGECTGGQCEHARAQVRARWLADLGGLFVMACVAAFIVTAFGAFE